MLKNIFVFLLTFSLLTLSCSKKNERQTLQLPQLVTVNDHGLDKDRFERDFVLTKSYRQATVIDSALIVSDIKKHYLNDLYLIAEAYEQGIPNDPEYKRMVHESWVTELTHIDGPLYKKIMPEQFDLSEEELKDLYEKVKTGYKAADIKLADKAFADSIYRELKKGADFAKMAETYSLDLRTAVYSGTIPWIFTYGTFARPFETALMKLKPGDISEPVQTNDGYHIIKLLATQKNPIDPYEKIEFELRKRLQKIKRTDFIQDYINGLFSRFNYKVDMETARSVWPLINQRHENGLLVKTEALKRFWNKPVIHYNGGNLTVGDVVYKYNQLPRFERIPLNRFGNFELILKEVSVQELMFRDAIAKHLDQDPLIVEKVNRFAYGRLLEFANRKLIADKTPVSDDEVRAYFDKNRSRWKNDTFDHVKHFVRFRVKSEKELQYKKQLLTRLKNKWQPIFYADVIRQTVNELSARKFGPAPAAVLSDSAHKRAVTGDSLQKNIP